MESKQEKKFDRYNQPLSKTNEYCILFLRFCCNFNEALLSAELVQTFLKFLGITLFSSTLIWGIPPIIVIFLGPFIRKKMLNQRYNSFLYLLIFLSIFFFINSVGFVLLFNLESYSALQKNVSYKLLFLGGISFTSIDMTKFIYEDQIIPYMIQYLAKGRKKNFNFYGALVEKLGRIFGAFVSCWYVLLRRTDFAIFSKSFLTNIQFTYYIGICLNSLSVFIIFLSWPRNFQLIQKPIQYESENLFDYYFPGVQLINKMQFASKFLLSRYFFSIGMYWFVCVTITQWISNKFMRDYPDTISNSAIQAVDVGTAWGSIGLTLFYALWGLGHLIVHPNKDFFIKYSHSFSKIANFISAILYLGCYIMYAIDLKIIVILLGVSGITFDWILYEKVQHKLVKDPLFQDDTNKIQKYKINQILASVEFLSEITFYIIVPCMLNIFSDRQQMLLFALFHLILSLTVPKKSKIEI